MRRKGLWLFFMLCLTGASYAQVEIYSDQMPMDSAFNTPSDEVNVMLSPDDGHLYFTRAGAKKNVDGTLDKGEIWTSDITIDGSWSTPVPVKTINNEGLNQVIGFLDPRTILVRDGNSLMTYYKFSGKWFEPTKFEIEYLNFKSEHFTASVSSDANFILMGMESFGTYGVEDLYVSLRRADNTWSNPKNLGSTINTGNQEVTPFLASDNKTLFFASNGHGGEGSFDIFMSERLDDTWQNWSAPKNMGPQVNTAGRETSFMFSSDEEVAYVISTQNSEGYGDIKRVKIMPDIEDPVAVTLPPGVNDGVGEQDGEVQSFIREKRADIEGRVVNSATGEAVVGAEIRLESTSGLDIFKGYTNSDGRYKVNVKGEQDYVMKASAGKYMSYEESIHRSRLFATGSHNVSLEPVEEGRTIALNNVLFQQGTAKLMDGSEKELDLVVELMKLNPDMSIFLAGHTDNRGKSSANVKLSKDRVDAVKEYLVSKKIADDRISGKGFGGTQPRASNANEETRKLNRRVEFTVHYKK